MIAPKFVRLIESHAEQLSRSLLARLLADERVSDIRKIPPDELRRRADEIYRHLGDWLMTRTEAEVASRYAGIGARAAERGVAVSHLVGAILLTKEHLWSYLRSETSADTPVEIFEEMELLRAADMFFDRAAVHAAHGHEVIAARRAA